MATLASAHIDTASARVSVSSNLVATRLLYECRLLEEGRVLTNMLTTLHCSRTALAHGQHHDSGRDLYRDVFQITKSILYFYISHFLIFNAPTLSYRPHDCLSVVDDSFLGTINMYFNKKMFLSSPCSP